MLEFALLVIVIHDLVGSVERFRVVIQDSQHLRKLTEVLSKLDRHICNMDIKVPRDMLQDTKED